MKIRVSLGTALAQAVLNDLASGAGANPKIQLYTGTVPAAMGNTISDTLLAEFVLSAAWALSPTALSRLVAGQMKMQPPRQVVKQGGPGSSTSPAKRSCICRLAARVMGGRRLR